MTNSKLHDRPPHEADTAVVSVRRGYLWIPGDRVETDEGTVQAGPMFVHWEAPPRVIQPYPLVLVHGGGGQGTDWLVTPDGRPGWASAFVESGFAVYVVDRPGHGRSPLHPAAFGAIGSQLTYQAARELFLAGNSPEQHSQWPFSRDPGGAEVEQLLAGMGPLPADLCYSQELDAARISKLLALLGRSIMVTHSAGAPGGWLAADRNPGLVHAIAAIEPVGPPFAEIPGIGTLTWGLTTAPMTFDPPGDTAEDIRKRSDSERRLPRMKDLPVRAFTGGASAFAGYMGEIVDFLNLGGADSDWLHLPAIDIHGNGHGLIFERNSDDTVKPVIDWLRNV